jgi:hypothetical protein
MPGGLARKTTYKKTLKVMKTFRVLATQSGREAFAQSPCGGTPTCRSKRTLLRESSVGARGFEPPTSCTPCKRASRAAPRPDWQARIIAFSGDSGNAVAFTETLRNGTSIHTRTQTASRPASTSFLGVFHRITRRVPSLNTATNVSFPCWKWNGSLLESGWFLAGFAWVPC